MGQIVGGAAKPKRCNLNKLSQLGTPADGEYILVSSDNSMNAAGQGNFDCYIEGNGTTAATALELKHISDTFTDLQSLYSELADFSEAVDLSGLTENSGQTIDGTQWVSWATSKYKFVDLEGIVKLKLVSSVNAKYAFVTSTSHTNGTSTCAGGCQAVSMPANTTQYVFVPKDAKYLYVATFGSSSTPLTAPAIYKSRIAVVHEEELQQWSFEASKTYNGNGNRWITDTIPLESKVYKFTINGNLTSVVNNTLLNLELHVGSTVVGLYRITAPSFSGTKEVYFDNTSGEFSALYVGLKAASGGSATLNIYTKTQFSSLVQDIIDDSNINEIEVENLYYVGTGSWDSDKFSFLLSNKKYKFVFDTANVTPNATSSSYFNIDGVDTNGNSTQVYLLDRSNVGDTYTYELDNTSGDYKYVKFNFCMTGNMTIKVYEILSTQTEDEETSVTKPFPSSLILADTQLIWSNTLAGDTNIYFETITETKHAGALARFYMYYSYDHMYATGNNVGIKMAYSDDLVHWTLYGNVMKAKDQWGTSTESETETPCVFWNGSEYIMTWHSTDDFEHTGAEQNTYLSRSNDGINWTYIGLMSKMPYSHYAGDCHDGYMQVINHDGMFYGFSLYGGTNLCYNTMEKSYDGINWYVYPNIRSCNLRLGNGMRLFNYTAPIKVDGEWLLILPLGIGGWGTNPTSTKLYAQYLCDDMVTPKGSPILLEGGPTASSHISNVSYINVDGEIYIVYQIKSSSSYQNVYLSKLVRK